MKTNITKAIKGELTVSITTKKGQCILCQPFASSFGWVQVVSSTGAVFAIAKQEIKSIEA
jgi:hypothetical protein